MTSMSTNDNTPPKTGGRIKDERERLGLSQAALAPQLGISRTTQVNYESGKRSPGGDYFRAFGALGADIGYVIFGERSNPTNLYRLAAARVLPLVAGHAGIDKDALFGILDIAAQDEANAWGGGASAQLFFQNEEKMQELVNEMFEDGKLLGQVFVKVQKTMHDSETRLPVTKLVNVVLTLYHAFKGSGKVDKRTVETAVKVAL